MNKLIKTSLLTSSFLLLWSAGQAPDRALGLTPLQEVVALVGVPVSPLSFAGVARRTTRRAVVYSGAASSAAYQQQAVAEQQAAPAAQPAPQQPAAAQPPRPDGAPPIGTVVNALPAGCASNTATFSGVQYYDCRGVYYRAAFQGNNLVYVVTQP
jgi:hypothetical protein